MLSFKNFPKIDAHIHFNTDRNSLLKLAENYGFSLLSINTEAPEFPSIEEQRRLAREYQASSNTELFYATTVPTDDIFEDNWADKAIAKIEQDIGDDARGVKFWKNIGMSIRRPDGSFLMLDDDKLKPVFDYLESNNIPVLGHQGEPKNCWLPVEEMTVKSDREYFAGHPEYHMYKHEEYPDYWKHIEARDRILERHPDLKFVGLHLASLEWSLEEVVQRLDRFPNLMVDLAERISHLYYHTAENRDRVIKFFEKYQDRIIYGTDIIDDPGAQPDEILHDLQQRWESHWQFLATRRECYSAQIDEDFLGLDLPKAILEKVYRTNAVKRYQLSDAL